MSRETGDDPAKWLTDVARHLRWILDPEPEISQYQAARLEEVFSDLANELLHLRDQFLLTENSDEERWRAGILLGAMIEWFASVGQPSKDLLSAVGGVFKWNTQHARNAVNGKFDALVARVRKSPLTYLPVNDQNRLVMRAVEDTRRALTAGGKEGVAYLEDEMDLAPDKRYGLHEAADYVGVDESAIKVWLESGVVSVPGTKRRPDGECELTAEDLRTLRTHCLKETIDSLIEEPDEWLMTPNSWLGGMAPRDLLGTPREQLVVDIVEGIKQGAVA